VSPTDAVRVTTTVAAAPAAAFRIFTEDIDAWWRRGPRFRPALRPNGVMMLEPYVGGRFAEVYDATGGDAFEIGRVRVWDPPRRLVVGWRARDFAPDESTEVEVRFEAAGDATRVVLVHRGFDALAADHPVRHGLAGPAFAAMIGLMWSELLVAARARA
jgi:uncharacterized protein YndB with AHSA1/START domain